MDGPQAAAEVAQFSFKRRNTKTKSILRKRSPSPALASDSDSGSTSSEDEQGRQPKRRRKTAGVIASSTNNVPNRIDEAKIEEHHAVLAIPTNSDNATKASHWYDEADTAKPQDRGTTETAERSGTYKGVASYQSFIQKNPGRIKQAGPVKSSSNVRTITVTDFAPDVCKDYKQTGYCGFGDSCKFLHSRDIVQQGWQLDQQWDKDLKNKKISGKTIASANRSTAQVEEEEDDALLEKIPFKCIICKEDYKQPIVTKCGHYFCEACALKRYRKDPSCAACGASTNGIFNPAKKLNRLLERKKKRQDLAAEQEKEEGEGGGGGGGGGGEKPPVKGWR